MTSDLMARIDLRLKQLGISARKASLDGGLGADAIRDIRRKPANSVTLETIQKLARGLQTTPEWLAYDVEDRPPAEPAPGGGLRVEGEVAAGTWLEISGEAQGRGRSLDYYEPVPVAQDMRWPGESQFGLIVRGTSINKVASEGDVLACVDCWALKRELRNDELVVVERVRDGGLLMERTAKFYCEFPDRYELWPHSTDERWQSPIIVPKRLGFDAEGGDGVTVRVSALVIWIHRPTATIGFRRPSINQ